MDESIAIIIPEIEPQLWKIYREFFDLAEKRRRWNISEDIPWNECNPNLNPAIADVVETFCAVELYLPDYNAKILPMVRPSKGRAWFYANWGYEESKHSMALADWLIKSGHRSEEYMVDLEKRIFEHEWNLPQDSHLGMLIYAMVQEQATFINYRNLRNRIEELGRDPALEKLLKYLFVDEKAHFSFFRDCVSVYLQHDRDMVIKQMRRVMNEFSMPAIHDLLDNSEKRVAGVRALKLFDPDIYYREVYLPILQSLGVSRNEMRSPYREKKSLRIS